jgi:signal transduction histidine kinase
MTISQTIDTTPKQPLILVVDDEPSILNSLDRVLHHHNYRVIKTTSGIEGLEILSREPIDLIISDMRMPKMDGAEFLSKAAKLSPNVVRILLTGNADLNSAVKAINQGQIFQYLHKPWKNEQLLSTINNGLQKRFVETHEKLKLERMKNEFISTVSHELRTPLTTMQGMLGLMKGNIGGELSSKTLRMVNTAYENGIQLDQLINNMLAVQKLEGSGLAFNMVACDMVPLLKQAVEDIAPYSRKKQVSVQLAKLPKSAVAVVDQDHFLLAMNSILSNAIKFSPTDEMVGIKLIKKENLFRISVLDNGEGIPKQFHDRLFDKFTQSNSSDTRKHGGVGIGLALCKMIVEKMGGQISFENGKKLGTVFYLDLPQVQ